MEESIRAASQQVSEEFKTLVKTEDLNSLRHLQNLMYVYHLQSISYFMWIRLGVNCDIWLDIVIPTDEKCYIRIHLYEFFKRLKIGSCYNSSVEILLMV